MANRRLLGFVAVVSAAGWLVSWLLNTATRDNNVLVLGQSEGDYRSFLNPLLVTFLLVDLAILLGERRAGGKLGPLGTSLIALGLCAMLVGNLVEFGLDGTLGQGKDAGFVVFLIGYLAFIPIGGILLARSRVATLRPPGRAGTSLLVGIPIGLAAPIVGHVIFAVAWALIGIGALRSGDVRRR